MSPLPDLSDDDDGSPVSPMSSDGSISSPSQALIELGLEEESFKKRAEGLVNEILNEKGVDEAALKRVTLEPPASPRGPSVSFIDDLLKSDSERGGPSSNDELEDLDSDSDSYSSDDENEVKVRAQSYLQKLEEADNRPRTPRPSLGAAGDPTKHPRYSLPDSWGEVSAAWLQSVGGLQRNLDMSGDFSGKKARAELDSLMQTDRMFRDGNQGFDKYGGADGMSQRDRQRNLMTAMLPPNKMIPIPVMQAMCYLLYPQAETTVVNHSSPKELARRVAEGVVSVADKRNDRVGPKHSADYWINKDPFGKLGSELVNMKVTFYPPKVEKSLKFTLREADLSSELYNRVERSAAEIGMDKEGDYVLELRYDGDDDEDNMERIKRSKQLGTLTSTKLRGVWVPRHCTVLFVNYFDGREYPVPINSNATAGQLYDVAKGILLNSTYPHVPEVMELFRYEEYDRALHEKTENVVEEGKNAEKLRKEAKANAEKRVDEAINAWADKLVKDIEADKDVDDDMKKIYEKDGRAGLVKEMKKATDVFLQINNLGDILQKLSNDIEVAKKESDEYSKKSKEAKSALDKHPKKIRTQSLEDLNYEIAIATQKLDEINIELAGDPLADMIETGAGWKRFQELAGEGERLETQITKLQEGAKDHIIEVNLGALLATLKTTIQELNGKIQEKTQKLKDQGKRGDMAELGEEKKEWGDIWLALKELVRIQRANYNIEKNRNGGKNVQGVKNVQGGGWFHRDERLISQSIIELRTGYIPKDSQAKPCAGYRKAKVYIVSQAKAGAFRPHYVYGNDEPTLANMDIGKEIEVRTITNLQMRGKAIDMAKKRGFLKSDDKGEKVRVSVGPNDLPNKSEDKGANLRFLRYFGDSLLRVNNPDGPVETQVTLQTKDGNKVTRTMRQDATMGDVKREALRIFGPSYMPESARKEYEVTGKPPSLEAMERLLRVDLFTGAKSVEFLTGKETDKPDQITRPLASKQGVGDIPVAIKFSTASGSDWGACTTRVSVSVKTASGQKTPDIWINTDNALQSFPIHVGAGTKVSQLKEIVKQKLAGMFKQNGKVLLNKKFELKANDKELGDDDSVCIYGDRQITAVIGL